MYPRKGNNYNKKKSPNRVFLFISKYWLIIIAFVIGFFPLFRFIKNQLAKNKAAQQDNLQTVNNGQNANLSPELETVKTNFIKKKYANLNSKQLNEIKSAAQRIAFALGTTPEQNFRNDWFDFYNFSGATEDEKTAILIAKQHSGTFPVLADFYYSMYTLSRNLKADLLKYLSNSDLKEIREAHIKHGGYHHI